jgi:ribosomal-protein-alanine N-acetyltransferase
MAYEIQTERLTLTACPAQVARAAGIGKRQFESLLGARVDDAWLEHDGRGLLSFYEYQIRSDPDLIGWGLWLIKHNADRVVFGSAGFKGKPDANGMIEIGYGISPQYRRQGYTFEATRALIDWGFSHPEVKRITAECLPENAGSARILEKLGMTQTGLRGGYLKWYLLRPSADGRA